MPSVKEQCRTVFVTGGIIRAVALMGRKTASILGCGYIGYPLALRLLNQGWRVKGSTTTSEKVSLLREAGIKPYQLKLDPVWVGEQGEDFLDSDVLFLNIPPGRRRPDVEIFYGALMESLLVALCDAHVSFVVFASSTSVYPPTGRRVTEEDAGNPPPETRSGHALLSAERLLLGESSFDTTVLRYAGLYGYDRAPGRFLKDTLINGQAPVNLVHRDDAVAVASIVINQGVRNEVFNVCADEHPTRAAFYMRAAEWLRRAPPQIAESSRTLTGKRVDNNKLKMRLGYTFCHADPMERAP